MPTKFVILSGAKRSRRTCFIACVTADRRPLQSLSPSRNEDVNRAKLSHKRVALSEATDGTRRRSGSHASGRSLKCIDETASSRRTSNSNASRQALPSRCGNACRSNRRTLDVQNSAIHKPGGISSFAAPALAPRTAHAGAPRAIRQACELRRHQRSIVRPVRLRPQPRHRRYAPARPGAAFKPRSSSKGPRRSQSRPDKRRASSQTADRPAPRQKKLRAQPPIKRTHEPYRRRRSTPSHRPRRKTTQQAPARRRHPARALRVAQPARTKKRSPIPHPAMPAPRRRFSLSPLVRSRQKTRRAGKGTNIE